MRAAKCPRCGADMTNGVCDNCGFPIVGSRRKRRLAVKARRDWAMSYR